MGITINLIFSCYFVQQFEMRLLIFDTSLENCTNSINCWHFYEFVWLFFLIFWKNLSWHYFIFIKFPIKMRNLIIIFITLRLEQIVKWFGILWDCSLVLFLWLASMFWLSFNFFFSICNLVYHYIVSNTVENKGIIKAWARANIFLKGSKFSSLSPDVTVEK